MVVEYRHGNSAGYSLDKCRCSECVNWAHEKAKRHYRRRKDFVANYKDTPCKDCGGVFPSYVMHFDHLPEFNKSFNLSQTGSRKSITQIKEEIKKCEVVCANCHAIRTYERSH